GWGNRELQSYTDEVANACLDGNGNLAITARRLDPGQRPHYDDREYTSARLVTKGLARFTYGVFEARATLPAGSLWPAFWMLGEDIDDVGWPACGEIDVLENFGHDPALVSGTVHGPGYSDGISSSHKASESLAACPHVYSVTWRPAELSWYIDGHRYATVTPDDLGGKPWVFDHPFYLLLNLAVGGTFSTPPTPATHFPQVMVVDYVRVYPLSATDEI
ncbi:MAG TPA: glycoside hydrolase family 16 protein, partial [Acidimicrobiales bacterium]|nr:glycoside hydrolase family 16 protein [Acidimicrobiales bacterium]